ncbi:hypothetical protein NN3_02840 [Nocardia neocaledoniensis NBRC 108232]|nr:hypothetical protein [Nocardia neocaledoniensis]GEM29277.1 hypothetical protein NN3_02840 [Nocardia neocaledoniensis NBRC 108232]
MQLAVFGHRDATQDEFVQQAGAQFFRDRSGETGFGEGVHRGDLVQQSGDQGGQARGMTLRGSPRRDDPQRRTCGSLVTCRECRAEELVEQEVAVAAVCGVVGGGGGAGEADDEIEVARGDPVVDDPVAVEEGGRTGEFPDDPGDGVVHRSSLRTEPSHRWAALCRNGSRAQCPVRAARRSANSSA